MPQEAGLRQTDSACQTARLLSFKHYLSSLCSGFHAHAAPFIGGKARKPATCLPYRRGAWSSYLSSPQHAAQANKPAYSQRSYSDQTETSCYVYSGIFVIKQRFPGINGHGWGGHL